MERNTDGIDPIDYSKKIMDQHKYEVAKVFDCPVWIDLGENTLATIVSKTLANGLDSGMPLALSVNMSMNCFIGPMIIFGLCVFVATLILSMFCFYTKKKKKSVNEQKSLIQGNHASNQNRSNNIVFKSNGPIGAIGNSPNIGNIGQDNSSFSFENIQIANALAAATANPKNTKSNIRDPTVASQTLKFQSPLQQIQTFSPTETTQYNHIQNNRKVGFHSNMNLSNHNNKKNQQLTTTNSSSVINDIQIPSGAMLAPQSHNVKQVQEASSGLGGPAYPGMNLNTSSQYVTATTGFPISSQNRSVNNQNSSQAPHKSYVNANINLNKTSKPPVSGGPLPINKQLYKKDSMIVTPMSGMIAKNRPQKVVSKQVGTHNDESYDNDTITI